MPTTVLIADDHPLFRDAIKSAICDHIGDGIEPNQMIEAHDFSSAMAALKEHEEVDLLLLDLNMPGTSGLSALVSVRASFPSVPVVIVSASDDHLTVHRAIELGASGFISKSASTEQIRQAVNSVLAGDIALPHDLSPAGDEDEEIVDLIARIKTLTPQQARVLGMLAEGLLNKQIAYELSVSEATVKAHVSAVLQKLDVDSRTQAVIRLSKIGADILRDSNSQNDSASS